MANQRDLPNIASYEFLIELVGRDVLTRDQGTAVVQRIVRERYDEARYNADLAGWAP